MMKTMTRINTPEMHTIDVRKLENGYYEIWDHVKCTLPDRVSLLDRQVDVKETLAQALDKIEWYINEEGITNYDLIVLDELKRSVRNTKNMSNGTDTRH